MATSRITYPEIDPSLIDDRIILHDVSWEQYEAILAMRGEKSNPRIAYLEGELELMSPSRSHEALKKCLARLLEAYAEERGLVLEGYGSLTMKKRPRKRGAEPDECYALGEPKEWPDLAIEVVWTRGGLDKLDIYRLLNVREVWFWERGRITVHALRGKIYKEIGRSELLPELDLEELAGFVRADGQTAAVREYRAALRRS